MVSASLPPVFGNAHLLLLHLPVGFMVAALLLEIWTWRDAGARPLIVKLLAANAWFAVLTAAAGLALAEHGGYPATALAWHRWAGLACAVTAVLAWWIRARKGLLAGRLALALLAVATTVAGHLGATLTHGDALFAWSARPAAPAAASATPGASPAAPTEVHPLLVKHCVECHGPEKQKGRLRLDSLASARAEGRSGALGLVPGDPEASELLRRVNLPRSDEEAMPPEDHAPLDAAERAELAAWIASLAPRSVFPP